MKNKKSQRLLKWTIAIVLSVLMISLLTPSLIKDLVAQEVKHSVEHSTNKEKASSVYEPVLPDYTIDYSKDFAEHVGFHNDVWHYKANLKGDDGLDYAVQWGMYRVANGDVQGVGWHNTQVYTAQVVVSNAQQSWMQQRLARGGIGQAGALMYPFRLWIDNWSWVSNHNFAVPSLLNVVTDDFSVLLKNANGGPFVLNGDNGYKKTHDLLSTASYSFSAPFLKTQGLLKLNGREVKVQGVAWLDKEWGNHLIADRSLRWDSFNIHLEDGRALSITQYHNPQNLRYISGLIAGNDGQKATISNDEVRIYPLEQNRLLNGRQLPLRWVIEIPKLHISLITKTLNNELWLPFWIPSWEGPIEVTGSHQGVGFMQLTGY